MNRVPHSDRPRDRARRSARDRRLRRRRAEATRTRRRSSRRPSRRAGDGRERRLRRQRRPHGRGRRQTPARFDASLGGPFQSGEDGVPELRHRRRARPRQRGPGLLRQRRADLDRRRGLRHLPGHGLRGPRRRSSQQFATTFTQLQAQTEAQNAGRRQLPRPRSASTPRTGSPTLDNEGDEDVEGTETIHISRRGRRAEARRGHPGRSPRTRRRPPSRSPRRSSASSTSSNDIIESAEFDIYTGADDDVLRKFEASLDLNPPDDGEGAPGRRRRSTSRSRSSELNEPQEIAAPTERAAARRPARAVRRRPERSSASLGAGGGGRSGAGRRLPQASGGSADAYQQRLQQAYLDCLAERAALPPAVRRPA